MEKNPWTPEGECGTPVTQGSLKQLNTWPVLNSEQRMRREPRRAQSHLKCQILGSADRSVKTLSWLWLTLPCGRDRGGLSQEIGIHEGSCARQCWTGHRLETQDCFYATSVTLVFKAVCKSWLERACCCVAALGLKLDGLCFLCVTKFFLLSMWKSLQCLSGHCGGKATRLQESVITKQTRSFSDLIWKFSSKISDFCVKTFDVHCESFHLNCIFLCLFLFVSTGIQKQNVYLYQC